MEFLKSFIINKKFFSSSFIFSISFFKREFAKRNNKISEKLFSFLYHNERSDDLSENELEEGERRADEEKATIIEELEGVKVVDMKEVEDEELDEGEEKTKEE